MVDDILKVDIFIYNVYSNFSEVYSKDSDPAQHCIYVNTWR